MRSVAIALCIWAPTAAAALLGSRNSTCTAIHKQSCWYNPGAHVVQSLTTLRTTAQCCAACDAEPKCVAFTMNFAEGANGFALFNCGVTQQSTKLIMSKVAKLCVGYLGEAYAYSRYRALRNRNVKK